MNKTTRDTIIDLPNVKLPGIFNLVENPKGLIIFTHGAGSSRLSPRNTIVSDILNNEGFSTFLFDLLTEQEDEVTENRFDINLMTDRLIKVTKWLSCDVNYEDLNFGYFGASTGAAAALKASFRFEQVKAIVSRGGRPDLAGPDLLKVEAPTLLIVGGLDDQVIDLNKDAFAILKTVKELVIIPGATHLFEEPGKMEEVAKTTVDWFSRHVPKGKSINFDIE